MAPPRAPSAATALWRAWRTADDDDARDHWRPLAVGALVVIVLAAVSASSRTATIS